MHSLNTELKALNNCEISWFEMLLYSGWLILFSYVAINTQNTFNDLLN